MDMIYYIAPTLIAAQEQVAFNDQHWVKTSFEGLVYESGPLYSQMSYLKWNAMQSYPRIKRMRNKFAKSLTWYCDSLGSCGGMGYISSRDSH